MKAKAISKAYISYADAVGFVNVGSEDCSCKSEMKMILPPCRTRLKNVPRLGAREKYVGATRSVTKGAQVQAYKSNNEPSWLVQSSGFPYILDSKESNEYAEDLKHRM